MKVILTVKFTNGCEEEFIVSHPYKETGNIAYYIGKDFLEFGNYKDKFTRIPFSNIMYYTVHTK